ncbi:MAG: MBL fold metallo-hydrolase [Christensenellaceae bacterium]|jgi:glyoxylase-like metal-dependent hydrolase (beta-lactamase superfamily II)|nr:MBL fold metallo-hydrolase [Christensenellaceae bacterium]
MQIQINLVKGLCNVYVIKYNDKAVVVDAAADIKALCEVIGDLEVVGVILTHGHYDHMRGLSEILKHFNTKCYLHKNAIDKLHKPDTNCSVFFGLRFISDADKKDLRILSEGKLDLLDLPINIVFTPGHTDCSVSFEIDGVVFTGDTLFKGGVGRFDLPTSNEDDLIRSLDKLKKLYSGHQFLPGHGSGGSI